MLATAASKKTDKLTELEDHLAEMQEVADALSYDIELLEMGAPTEELLFGLDTVHPLQFNVRYNHRVKTEDFPASPRSGLPVGRSSSGTSSHTHAIKSNAALPSKPSLTDSLPPGHQAHRAAPNTVVRGRPPAVTAAQPPRTARNRRKDSLPAKPDPMLTDPEPSSSVSPSTSRQPSTPVSGAGMGSPLAQTSTSSSSAAHSAAAGGSGNTSPTASPRNKTSGCERQMKSLLNSFCRSCQTFDKDNWFENPVTNQTAPCYEQMILRPNCFESIRADIESGKIRRVQGLFREILRMCLNAQMYNPPDHAVYAATMQLRSQASLLYGTYLKKQKSILDPR
eukprot:TRINITY_DN68783_c0_g1_i1.p1 TRINITY_DN68783_c0_g1~~TRINITY_DN68783_c0_g1_i1.p1  ORF type:complete len:338 (-),score=14.86 TRINITY_DN68783_c0_g1_i1:76-1089(-)